MVQSVYRGIEPHHLTEIVDYLRFFLFGDKSMIGPDTQRPKIMAADRTKLRRLYSLQLQYGGLTEKDHNLAVRIIKKYRKQLRSVFKNVDIIDFDSVKDNIIECYEDVIFENEIEKILIPMTRPDVMLTYKRLSNQLVELGFPMFQNYKGKNIVTLTKSYQTATIVKHLLDEYDHLRVSDNVQEFLDICFGLSDKNPTISYIDGEYVFSNLYENQRNAIRDEINAVVNRTKQL